MFKRRDPKIGSPTPRPKRMNKLRSISAALLAGILLTVSCVAARCEVMCDLGTTHVNCETATNTDGARSKQHSMTGMGDCGMKMQSTKASNAGAFSSADSKCEHRVCKQAPAVVRNEQGLRLPLSTLQAVFVVAAFSLHQAELAPQKATLQHSPPLRSISLIEFNTSLRI